MAAAGGVLLHVDLASVPGARPLGGSALAQAYSQAIKSFGLSVGCV
jgi:hypothetical protein